MADSWKFGDVIENRSASADNPTRRGYFVRVVNRTGRLNPGRHAELTDGEGKTWLQPLSGEYLVRVRNSTVGPRF
jgi:hypothetical protein